MSARYSMLYNATEHFKLITEGKKEFFHPCWPNNVTVSLILCMLNSLLLNY